MAIIDGTETDGRRTRKQMRVGGFLAGALGCLCLGLMAGILYGGGGIGDRNGTPPQVYTNF